MYFDPKTNKFPYPVNTDGHYLKVKKNNGLVFDENYPYIDNSKKAVRSRRWTRLLLNTMVFPFDVIRLGLKIKGKENLKKYKDVIDKGVISVSNHIHMFDYISIMLAIKPHKPNVLVWAQNIRGESSKLIRNVGGIPIPEDNLKATITYVKQIKEHINSGNWLHIYAEGSMWEYYAPIRPFKRGAAFFSVETNKPIIPMAFSYRKPNWIRRVIFKQIACFTLNIGEPIYPNNNLPRKERELELTKRVHEQVCILAGIDPKDNIYESYFNDSKRIDYYTDTYGIKYKGSW